ncbi:unnamed protein product, partial [Nesidiocoris tenuis]
GPIPGRFVSCIFTATVWQYHSPAKQTEERIIVYRSSLASSSHNSSPVNNLQRVAQVLPYMY